MKVKELIKQLQELPQEDDIVITAMDDYFYVNEFEVHSNTEDGVQEIVLNVYVDNFEYDKNSQWYDSLAD